MTIIHRNETTRLGNSNNPNNLSIRHKNPTLSDHYRLEQPCRLSELKDIEETSMPNSTRLMLVSPDRRRKLDPIESRSVRVPSRTLSIYSRENQTQTKSCSICLNGVWTWSESVCRQIYANDLEFCQRDEIDDAQSVFILENGSEAALSQSLFEPGSVKVVYRLSETTKVCRACLSDGKWTKFAQSSICDSKHAFESKTRTSVLPELTNKTACPVKDLDKGSLL